MADRPMLASSEDIIASLINEVQQSKTVFDVKSLIALREKGDEKSSRSRSHSPTVKREKKEKKHKGKKGKKSKKWKRTPSRSPSKKKKKHKDRSHLTSEEKSKFEEEGSTAFGKESFAKASMEQHRLDALVSPAFFWVSDDEDDLPVGADFRTLASGSESKDTLEVVFKARPVSPDIIKRKEFVRNEEVFPLSKSRRKKERSESPPMKKKFRPLSEILARVRAEKSGTLVPRNVKLKHDSTKSDTGISRGCDALDANGKDAENSENEEYGPMPAFKRSSGPLPISDDDEEATFSGKIDSAQLKVIRIGALSEATIEKVSGRQSFIEHSGEVPVSDASTSGAEDLSSRNAKTGDQENDLRGRNESISDHGKKERKKTKHEKKRKKEKKKNKKEKKKHLEGASSSSDSEKEWERLRKRQKMRHDSVSSKSGSRFASGSTDYMFQARRGVDGANGTFSGRSLQSGREKRTWTQGDKSMRLNSGKFVSTLRRPRDRRQYRRYRNSVSSERKRSRSNSRLSSRSSRSRSHSRASSRRSSRSKSRSRSRRRSDDGSEPSEYKIDKKKLLEIAQKNAAQMAQLGYLPNATPEVVARMKTGMQSVDQLVDFCQKLQRSQEKDNGENDQKASSDEDGLLPKKRKVEESTDFVKHPFALKPSAPITINITNAAPIPIKTPSQRAVEESQLRVCYPVSSGQQHREKDSNEWVPVKKDSGEEKKNAASSSVKISKSSADPNSSFLLPPPPTPPVLLPHCNSAPSTLLTLPPPPLPPPFFGTESSEPAASLLGTMDPVTIPDDMVFQEPTLQSTPANVGKVLAKRLEANKRLCENPNDFDAILLLKEAEEQINAWAASKNLPGKFSGSTGVNVLSADQLGPDDPRYSAWAKKDFFKSANKVSSGVGLKLMQKMGWTPGEGLGKDRDGPLEPLTLDVKSDRKGLVAVEDMVVTKKSSNAGLLAAGKHPVSILMELCSKKRWSAPQFTCFESGPSNNRRFLWKAVVNGVEYQPALPSNSKKTGKAQTCQVVLQSLGLVPKDPSLPVIL